MAILEASNSGSKVSCTLVPNCPRCQSVLDSVQWTLRNQRKNVIHFGIKHSAEMSWVRSVLGPKCTYTIFKHFLSTKWLVCNMPSPQIHSPQDGLLANHAVTAMKCAYCQPQSQHYLEMSSLLLQLPHSALAYSTIKRAQNCAIPCRSTILRSSVLFRFHCLRYCRHQL